MLRRSAVMFAVVGCTAALVAGCGSSKSSSSSSAAPTPAQSTPAATSTAGKTHFAKSKFVLHFGLAAGAFHRWIYRPFRAGVFGKPATHKAAIAKAAIAALFTYHELKLAAADVKSSKILSTLFSPITALASKLQALRNKVLHGGKVTAADVNPIQSGGNSIAGVASAKGYNVSDATPAQIAQAGGPSGP